MIKINITKQSDYPVSSVKIRKRLKEFLETKGIKSDSEVNLAMVGKKKMIEIAEEYLGEKDQPPHNVLSFLPEETKKKFIFPPDDVIHLGDIIICYPVAFEEAKIERIFAEDKVFELVEHGALHLLGEHHI